MIRVKGWFLSEWFPKVPGRYWYARINGMPPCNRVMLDAVPGSQCTSVFQFRPDLPPEERQILLASFQTMKDPGSLLYHYDQRKLEQGVVRLSPVKDKDFCAVLCLLTADEWRCERGIPVIVSPQVYAEYLKRRVRQSAVEVTMDARLVMASETSVLSSFVPALGADVSRQLSDLLSQPMGIPICFLHVVSPIDIVIRSHSSHPDALVSTIGEFTGPYRRTDRLHSFCFFQQCCVLDPSQEPAMREAEDYMNEGWRCGDIPFRLLNDFDAQRRRVSAALPVRFSARGDASIARIRGILGADE